MLNYHELSSSERIRNFYRVITVHLPICRSVLVRSQSIVTESSGEDVNWRACYEEVELLGPEIGIGYFRAGFTSFHIGIWDEEVSHSFPKHQNHQTPSNT